MLDEVKKALYVLKAGGTILYPTDTIWGIGCDATSRSAAEKVYNIKARDRNKSMLVLLDSADKLVQYIKIVPEIPPEFLMPAEKPMTIIYPYARNLAKNLISDDGTIGIRITRDKFCFELITRFGKPIVSTSANKEDKPFPKRFSDIDKDIINAVDHVVNCRQDEKMEYSPSKIIKIGIDGQVEIIRE